MVEWFKHDFKARTHPRLQRIQMKYNMEGVGIYWSLIEMLYEEDGRLMLSECDAYAFALRVDSERLANFIKESGAFILEGNVFYSDTVNERMQERADKSVKASNNAKKRWDNANAMRTHSEGNAIREEKSREEEKRDKEKRKRFIAPTLDEVKFEMGNDIEAEKFVDYYTSKGWKVGKSAMVDWKASVRTWKRNIKDFAKPEQNNETWKAFKPFPDSPVARAPKPIQVDANGKRIYGDEESFKERYSDFGSSVG